MTDTEEKTQEEAWNSLTLKQKRAVIYYLGIENGPDGFNCYGNKTRAYFYAYYWFPEDDEAEVPQMKEQIEEVDADGNVHRDEEYTKEYRTAMNRGPRLFENDSIQEAMDYIRDEVKPHEEIKEMARQKKDMSIRFRASEKLLELEGEGMTKETRDFVKGIQALANNANQGDE